MVIYVPTSFRHRKRSQQRRYYSGKKRRHTIKNTVLSDQAKQAKQVIFIGKIVVGSRYNYPLLKEEFKPEKDWFRSVKVAVDLEYQGIKSDYLSPENISILYKKSKKFKQNTNPLLTRTQKQKNREIGRNRVAVEQAIGGMKTFNILTNQFRSWLKNFANEATFLAASL